MESDSRLPWIAAIILLFVAMFFAISETAISSSSRNRLKVFSDNGNKRADAAIAVIDNFDKAITTILICTNIVHISIATLVTVAVTKMWGVGFVSISTIITTMAVFLVGEMIPKSIAKKYAEDLAMFCAPVLELCMAVFKPLAWLLTVAGEAVSKLIKGEPELSVTEEELFDIIEDLTEDGTLNEQQGELISSALQFGDLTVERIMTHRVKFVSIDADSSVSDILSAVKSCTHSRLPVYEGSIDNIIGIVQIRKFIKNYLKYGESLDIRTIMDEPLFVKHDMNIDDLLPVMSRNKQSLAIVTDEFGGTFGLVTIEDMVEELVGEIWDEDDTPPSAETEGEKV